MNEKRRGRQEPTSGFTLPYTETKGAEAVELYEKTGRTAQDWQKNLIFDAMAIEDGEWVHSRFGFSVPRQNGKNEVIAIREMWGLLHGERILHTAHRTATSRAAWERLTFLLNACGVFEIKGEITEGYKSGKSKGQETIIMDEVSGGGRISFRTRSTTGGLGETFDLLVIDEAQEYQDDQESALKYTIVSSDNPQTVFLGTPPTPYSSGTIFPKLRKSILCGEMSHAGWAEWSVEEETDPHDIEAWYETNPSLGYKLRERAIEEEIGGDKIDFNIQRLGLWIKYNQKSAISKAEWAALCVGKLPKLTGFLGVGIKFSKDGGSVSMSICGKTEEGLNFVECIGCHPMRDGLDWMTVFLKRLEGNYSKVVIDGANGLDLMTKAMKDCGLKAPHPATVKDIIDANAAFEQGVFNKTLCHMEQGSVEQIVSNCEKRAIGSQGGFGYKATNLSFDISIMDSIILASWCVDSFKPRKKQRVTY